MRFRDAAFQHNIETAVGNQAAAWVQARDAYLAYRRQGGYVQYGGGKLVDEVLELITQQKVDEVNALFQELASDAETPDSIQQLMQARLAIFNGSCDPALADDPALDYGEAAEILFLLARVGAQNTTTNEGSNGCFARYAPKGIPLRRNAEPALRAAGDAERPTCITTPSVVTSKPV